MEWQTVYTPDFGLIAILSTVGVEALWRDDPEVIPTCLELTILARTIF
jgi:hypothetical protein